MSNDQTPRIRVYLERVRLDAGGYVRKGQAVPAGTYYGIGAPLYRYYAEWNHDQATFDSVCDEIRANDRDDAKEQVRAMVSSFPSGARLVFAGKW